MTSIKVPIRYIPYSVSLSDQKKQTRELLRSRKLYKKREYYTRRKLRSFTSKPSNHIQTARKLYGVDHIAPTKELSQKTGCSISAMRKIVKKGEGAYYSSGSRPNQTAQSWGYARLASALTSGKSAAVDYDILEKGCNHRKPAFILAKRSRKKYNHGQSHTKRRMIQR
jgi:hypothetical protein